MKIKRIFKNIIFSIGFFFIIFGVIEAYFRIFNPQPIRPAVYKTDPIYGIRMIPGYRGYLREMEYKQPFHLNSLGFRDKEREKSNPYNTFRIIGLGDSFSWGAGVEKNDTFLKRLEEVLNRNSEEIYYEVFNWGVSAWGTVQQLLCLKHQALAYNPDLVIIQYFTGNDLTDNIYSNLLKLDKEGNLIPSYYGRQKITRIKKITNYIPFYRSLTQHSHLMNFIRIRLLMRIEKSDEKNISNILPSDKLGYGLQLTKALLEEFFSIALENGIRIAMLVIPEKSDVCPSSKNSNPTQQQKFFKEGLMLSEVCRSHNVALLEFLTIFTQKDASAIYYEIDGHLSPYGHKVVAESLEIFLKQNHLLMTD